MSRAVPAHVVTSDSAIGGSVIERSLKFNRSDAPYLQATLGDGNEDKWTWSAWVKKTINEQHQNLFSSGSDSVYTHINFDNNDRIRFQNWHSAQKGTKITTRKIRDLTSWMHIVIIWDSGNSTADDRMRIYVNGTRETAFDDSTNPDQNQDSVINGNSLGGSTYGNGKHFVGKFADTSDNSGTYQTEINFVDGQAYDPSYFGFTDSQTGIWRPKKYEESYGSNGFRLDFSDNSAVTAITLGKDRSGQGNDFTPNNLSVSAGVGNDSVEDTPTNNFPTLNPLFLNATEAAGTFSEGNLKLVTTGSEYGTALSTFSIRYGKYYWEVKQLGGSYATHGIVRGTTPNADCFVGYDPSGKLFGFGYNQGGNIKGASGTGTTGNANLATSLATFTTNDIIGFASDISKGTLAIYKNNTLIYTITGINDDDWIPAISGYTSNGSYSINFGQQPFNYTPPTGYKKLNSNNLLPTVPSIENAQKHFDNILYTGNGGTKSVTGLGFKPDFVWVKSRNAGYNNYLFDILRGSTNALRSNTTAAESQVGNSTLTLTSNGFKLTSDGLGLNSAHNMVAWCWKAGGVGVTNNDGTKSVTLSANPEAGFSIIEWAGNDANATCGHGLGKKPKFFIVKSRTHSQNWFVYHVGTGATKDPRLNDTAAPYTTSNIWNNTEPTDTVINIGSSSGVNGNGNSYICYCWSEIPGYSKMGTYVGNGNANGAFVHTGFRPSFIMIRNTVNGHNWQIYDVARSTINPALVTLYANRDLDEEDNASVTPFDILSNGFKIRSTWNDTNQSGSTILYMAWAEQSGSTAYSTEANAR